MCRVGLLAGSCTAGITLGPEMSCWQIDKQLGGDVAEVVNGLASTSGQISPLRMWLHFEVYIDEKGYGGATGCSTSGGTRSMCVRSFTFYALSTRLHPAHPMSVPILHPREIPTSAVANDGTETYQVRGTAEPQ